MPWDPEGTCVLGPGGEGMSEAPSAQNVRVRTDRKASSKLEGWERSIMHRGRSGKRASGAATFLWPS